MNKLEELPLKPKNKHQPYRVVMTTQKGRTCRERRWCGARVAHTQLSGAESTKNWEPAVFRKVQHISQCLSCLPVVHRGRELRGGPSVVVGRGLLAGPPLEVLCRQQIPVG